MESHLLQMRGLKLLATNKSTVAGKSHLLQMRGLKPNGNTKTSCCNCRIFYRCVD